MCAAKTSAKKAAAEKAYGVPAGKSSKPGQPASGQVINWQLVQQYLPLVKGTVARMRLHFPDSVDSADMYSIALAGLVTAAQQFNQERGVPFGGYARIRVKGALLDELRRMDWMPRAERTQTKKLNVVKDALEQKLGRPPTEAEMATDMGITLKAVKGMQSKHPPVRLIPLNAPVHAAGGGSDEGGSAQDGLEAFLSDITELDARERTEKKELVGLLRAELENLSEIAQKVLILYYVKELRLAEIAEVFELTESRICQIHAQAIKHLRKALNQGMAQ